MTTPTPTQSGSTLRPGTFQTLTEALDYAATGATGMNFHSPRGELTEVMSYTNLARDARTVAAQLLAAGLAPGDRVGLIAETHGDFVRSFMGCLYARLIPCPMPLPSAFGSRNVYGEQIRRIADVAACRAVLSPEEYVDWIEAPLEPELSSGALLYLGPLSGLPATHETIYPQPPSPEALAYLQFSSGTTQAPKGVAVTHKSLMANLKGMGADALKFTNEDRGVSWLPFYHDMGLVGCVLLPIATQMSIDYLATRDFIKRPTLWLQMISRAKATMSYSPSFGYQLASRRARNLEGLDLSSWRIAGIGGDMIKTANLSEFAKTYAGCGFEAKSFVPSYGMAELTLSLTFTPLGSGCRSVRLDLDRLEAGEAAIATSNSARDRSFAMCGHVLPDHQIEIRDQTGAVLTNGRVGTVHARGPSMMLEYFRNQQATKAALSPDGWLDTGDLGCIVDGELVLTGRGKDLIIVNGRNIWPQDLEWTVEHQLEGVREGGVVAFGAGQGTSDAAEEEVAIVIECRTSEPGLREAMRTGADSLVRELHGVSPTVALAKPGLLPRTSSGKLSRPKAREMYFQGRFQV